MLPSMARSDLKILALLGFNCTGDVGPYTFYRSKRGQLVWFPRAPALNPPSQIQLAIRQRFKQAGADWRTLNQSDRAAWLHTSKCCGLAITGYNLWVYWRTIRDLACIRAIERSCQTTLNMGP